MDLDQLLLPHRQREGIVDAILYYHAIEAPIDNFLKTEPQRLRDQWNHAVKKRGGTESVNYLRAKARGVRRRYCA